MTSSHIPSLIEQYAKSLVERIGEHYHVPLNLSYRKSMTWDANGHQHRFTIREGSRWIDRYIGEKVLEGKYYDRGQLGAGKQILVHDTAHSEAIKDAVMAANTEYGVQITVKPKKTASHHFPGRGLHLFLYALAMREGNLTPRR